MAARRTGTPTAPGRCPSCRAPVIKQLVEVLDIVADAAPIERADEHRLREPNRLTWCLTAPVWAPPRLRWRCPEYAARCDHQVLIEHRCTTRSPPPAATTEQQPALF